MLWESDVKLKDLNRFSRQIIVPHVGTEGHALIKNTSLLIIGLGGLGSPVLTYLSMAGFRKIGIVDFDKVEIHNLQRQSIHSEETVGEYKTESAEKFVKRVNSQVEITKYNIFLDKSNIGEIINNFDIIIDCCDQIVLRYVINDACRVLNKDLVSASVLKWEGQVYVIPKNSLNCYRCLFPEMKATAGSCDTSGVIGSMCGLIGSIQATEVIKLVLSKKIDNSDQDIKNSAGNNVSNNIAKIIVFNGFSTKSHFLKPKSSKCTVCINGINAKIDYSISTCSINSIVCPGKSWDEILKDFENYLIIDARKEVHYKMFRIKNSLNIEELEEIYDKIKGDTRKIIITCYRGNKSKSIVEFLSSKGIIAFSAEGGIEAFKKIVLS